MLLRHDIKQLLSGIMPAARSRLDLSSLNFAQEYSAAWLAGVIGLLLSFVVSWAVQQQLHSEQLLEFKWVAQNRHRALYRAIDNGLQAAKSVRDLFLVSEQVPQDQFSAFAQSLLERYQGIHALAWVPRVPAAPGAASEGSHSMAPSDSQGQRFVGEVAQPPQHGDSDFFVLYVEPYQRQESLLGFDFGSDPRYRELLERAGDSGALVASKRIRLESPSEEQFGFAVFLPVYKKSVPATMNERRHKLVGFVVGVFAIGDLARTATALLVPRGVEFLIRDESAPEDEQFLAFYSSRLSRAEASGIEERRTSIPETRPQLTEVFQVADRQWSITYAMTPQFRTAEGFEPGPWVVLASGLLLTVLLTLYLFRVRYYMRVRLAMEEAIREREELFRQMTDVIQEVFWVQTPDLSQVLYVSPAYETIWGRSCKSMYRDPSSFLEGIHPDDRAKGLATAGTLPHEEAEEVYRVVRPDGTMRWVRCRAFNVYAESGEVYRIAGIREDITAMKETEEALRQSERELRAVFYQSPDTIKTVDSTGQILFINRSLPNLSAEEAIGRDSIALMPSDYQKKYQKSLKRLFKGGKEQHFQYTTDGSDWWDLRISPIWREDVVMGAMVIETDVTEKRARQAQAVRSARLASLGVLAASVAHEINNPNSAIQSNTSILARMFDDALPIIRQYNEENGEFILGGMPASRALDTVPRLVGDIKRSAHRIEQIVGNLKHVVRHDKGDLSQDVELSEVLEAAVSILRNKINEHTDNFTMDVPETLPIIKGNGQQLEQVFINVVVNALEALPDRSHGVHVAAVEEESEEYVRVIVRDEGIGIAEENMGKLTEPLYTTKVGSGGTGLGLSISNAIVRDHQGKMEFDSEQGKGTVVTIRLPVNRSATRNA